MVSWEVPVKYGVISRQMLLDQRDSNTMSDEAFSMESNSIWYGSSSEAWLNSKNLNQRRTLLKCERQAQQNCPNKNMFYVLAVDVGRYRANTAIMVIKVLPQENSFKKNVIYTEVIHGANYITEQAPRIKELIELYHPREVVIDGNGRINWPTW